MNNIIQYLAHKNMKLDVPRFRSGDTLELKIWVVEGLKKRIQTFEGTVIAIRNRCSYSIFTIRKISNGEGVERTFQTNSPIIHNIVIKRHGTVRKAKLYYLRKRVGKYARIREKTY